MLNTFPSKSAICLHTARTYFLTTSEDSSQLAPNIKKLSELEATLFPVFKKLSRNEHAVPFLPKGHPSPPNAIRKVPSVSANHFSASLREFCTFK